MEPLLAMKRSRRHWQTTSIVVIILGWRQIGMRTQQFTCVPQEVREPTLSQMVKDVIILRKQKLLHSHRGTENPPPLLGGT